jgi:filamentous hemagglutinin
MPRNVFNTFGTIQGDTVTLAAVDSIFNTSGLIKGRDVRLTPARTSSPARPRPPFSRGDDSQEFGKGFAGVFWQFTRTTSETVGQRGSIEATGDLSHAGRARHRDCRQRREGRRRCDVFRRSQRGDCRPRIWSRTVPARPGAKSSFNTQTSKAATVEAGGSVSISAGQDVTVHGSSVSAGADVDIEAGRDVSITAATDGYDYYFKKKRKGGFFGGSSSEMRTGKVTTNVASAITAGGDVNVVAGKGGAGDLAIVGSKVRSGVDMSLKAVPTIIQTEQGLSIRARQRSCGRIQADRRCAQRRRTARPKTRPGMDGARCSNARTSTGRLSRKTSPNGTEQKADSLRPRHLFIASRRCGHCRRRVRALP